MAKTSTARRSPALATKLEPELKRELAAAGLLISQVLTLYTTPVIYLAMDRLRHLRKTPQVATPVPSPTTAGEPVA